VEEAVARGQVARGWSGGVGSVGWAGRAHMGSVGWVHGAGVHERVGQLFFVSDHHPR
jgi:hypothetical protein